MALPYFFAFSMNSSRSLLSNNVLLPIFTGAISFLSIMRELEMVPTGGRWGTIEDAPGMQFSQGGATVTLWFFVNFL